MKKIKQRGTDIEIYLRSILHKSGFRFGSKNDKIIGKPDIILPKHKTVIFTHGCFWHGHKSCRKGKTRPVKNVEFWNDKILRNKKRDSLVKRQLKRDGWKVVTIWECEIKNPLKLTKKLNNSLTK
jgi:DNA mismatch endonuclease (patch repair protein)